MDLYRSSNFATLSFHALVYFISYTIAVIFFEKAHVGCAWSLHMERGRGKRRGRRLPDAVLGDACVLVKVEVLQANSENVRNYIYTSWHHSG